MIETVLSLLRRTLRVSGAALALVGQAWRLWLATALLGAALAAALGWAAPPRWASEGTLTLAPRFLLEGYLLATSDLGAHYATRLAAPTRLEQTAARLRLREPPTTVWAQAEPGGIVRLRVEHADPAAAEALARALLADLRAEIEAENRTREEADRLTVTISPTSFARWAQPPLWQTTLLGGGSGLAAGVGLVLLGALRQRGRVAAPQEAERLVGAPTLGAIPGRSWRFWKGA